RPVAGMLMLPYLIWLLFAGVLNWQIHQLNPYGVTMMQSVGDTQIVIQ
ncbi:MULTISPECIES: tryptophan-rich sensory protein, partial [unclassified Sphingomonas]